MNQERLAGVLSSAPVVLLAGPSRSGVSLAAAKLAAASRALVLQPPAAVLLDWLQRRPLADPLPPDLLDTLTRHLQEIHGVAALKDSLPTLLLPLSQADCQSLSNHLVSLGRCQLVLLQRHRADLICSLARFPHLQPDLPCPRQQRTAFVTAALALVQHQDDWLNQFAQRLQHQGIRCHRLPYESLVGNQEVLNDLVASLDLAALQADDRTTPSGITPSLCFRERPLDQASVGRWERQLSANDLVTLAIDRPATLAMATTTSSDPLILTGRGGSGTRLLADAVLSQGVDLGERLNASSDSIQWADLFYEIALNALAGHPDPWSGSWEQELRHRAAVLALRRPAGQPWGFKLPEVMLALEPVLRTWPSSPVVHLVRHPLDTCLRRTHMTSRTSNPVGQALLRQAYAALERGIDPEQDPPHLRNAVSWWYQLRELQAVRQGFPGRIIEVRYEDLCDQPEATTHGLMQELGMPTQPVMMAAVDTERRRRWSPGDPRIADVWELCGPIAEAYGYSTT